MCECGSNRELRIDAKVSDRLALTFVPADVHDNEDAEAIQKFGYVPRNIGIGGGDYLRLNVCLDCNKVQNFPELEDEDILDAMNKM